MLSKQNLPIEGNTDNLILVLMEDTHREANLLMIELRKQVLILVLMENTHRDYNE